MSETWLAGLPPVLNEGQYNPINRGSWGEFP